MTPIFARQTHDPLYPQILYNRPVTRAGAGRLLLVGGHTGEFSQPTAYNQLALAAGAGECLVVMPDKLATLLGGAPGVYFGASTQSGSLSREALGRILELHEDADALALGVSLSNNSDTTILLERLVTETPGSLILFGDGLPAARSQAPAVVKRPNTLFILTMAEALKLCGALGIGVSIRHGAGLLNKLEIIKNLAAAVTGDVAVFGTEIIIASADQLTVTPVNYRLSLQPTVFYAVLSAFWLQNRSNRLAGLTTGAYVVHQVGEAFSQTDNPTVTQLSGVITQTLRAQEDW